jgi:hypothetical protein
MPGLASAVVSVLRVAVASKQARSTHSITHSLIGEIGRSAGNASFPCTTVRIARVLAISMTFS